MITINGAFLTEDITGVQRYATEILKRLDGLVQGENVELLVPYPPEKSLIQLKNIRILYSIHKRPKRHLKLYLLFWEQVLFTFYLITHRSVGLNMCNKTPLLKPDIVCIHDILFKSHAELFPSLPKWKRMLSWLRYYCCCKFSKIIITDSKYSEMQIIKHYHIRKEKIIIIGCGWEHILKIKNDDTIFEKYPMLKKSDYYFVLGSLSPHKNIAWVLEIAKKNMDSLFVITGKKILDDCNRKVEKNVIFTGYLTDEEIHSIMSRMSALIFPSFCEGFGLPPLEALSMGKKIIISNRTSLPEIYGNSAVYINPDDTNVNLKECLEHRVSDPDSVLNKYMWKNSAIQYKEVIVDEFS